MGHTLPGMSWKHEQPLHLPEYEPVSVQRRPFDIGAPKFGDVPASLGREKESRPPSSNGKSSNQSNGEAIDSSPRPEQTCNECSNANPPGGGPYRQRINRINSCCRRVIQTRNRAQKGRSPKPPGLHLEDLDAMQVPPRMEDAGAAACVLEVRKLGLLNLRPHQSQLGQVGRKPGPLQPGTSQHLRMGQGRNAGN